MPLPNLDDPGLYINRELSWLEFNRRVLEEARDPKVPLMERLKFLAIYSANLDEFFMVRVGGLQQKVLAGITRSFGADKMPPLVQLERISLTVAEQVQELYRIMAEDVLPSLDAEGIVIRRTRDLTDADRKHLRTMFGNELFPVLTPLAIDPVHPFPHLLNKSLNLAVVLKRPRNPEKLFAVVQVPAMLPRFVQLPAEKGFAFALLETAIRLHLGELFPGMELSHATVFRVTRDSEYEIDDDEVEDLLKAIEEEVRKRKRGAAVRLEIEADAPVEIEQFLMNALNLEAADVFRMPKLLDPTGLFQIYNLPGFTHLRDPQFVPQPVPDFASASSMWTAIRARDILVHHPYESFNPVVEFIEAAALDDKVLAIKQTLYRTSSDSPIVPRLGSGGRSGQAGHRRHRIKGPAR